MSSEPEVSVLLPNDVGAVERIYSTDPMVHSIVTLYADEHGLSVGEALPRVAGKRIGATLSDLGVTDPDNVESSDVVEVTITGKFDDA